MKPKGATHKMGYRYYRKTERGVFRLSAFGEWVRSSITPKELQRSAQSLAEPKEQEEQTTA